MIDITARKQLEEERQIEIAEMEAVFKTLPELMFRLDKDGRILSYKTGREDLLYLKPEDFLNKSMFDVLPTPIGIKFKKILQNTFKSHNQSTLEYTLDVPAGKTKFEARFFYISENLMTVVIRKL
jgi:PAS domain-containing protein